MKSRPLPAWFDDAKLGVLIHWGPYTVPAWAEPSGNFHDVSRAHGWEHWFRHNAYPEWYWSTISIEDSPARAHHDATYGADFPYERFAPLFEDAAAAWRPDAWAELFAQAGMRYAVLVTKHHDGWCLWPSRVAHPTRPGWHAQRRDYVAEFAGAMRARGLDLGLYYSGGLDWTFSPPPIRDLRGMGKNIPQGPEYLAYAQDQIGELVARFAPRVLWNDIGWPKAGDPQEVIAAYYAAVPDGVVNDRFRWDDPSIADFTTPEYTVLESAPAKKWEATRGLSLAFGYNANEGPEHTLSSAALIALLVDVVSKGGNLLLGVGPRADGSIPELQRERLEALGAWLRANGEAIYGTRPCAVAEATSPEGVALRFTRKGDVTFAIALGARPGATLSLPAHVAPGAVRVRRLDDGRALAPARGADGLAIRLDPAAAPTPAVALALSPA